MLFVSSFRMRLFVVFLFVALTKVGCSFEGKSLQMNSVGKFSLVGEKASISLDQSVVLDIVIHISYPSDESRIPIVESTEPAVQTTYGGATTTELRKYNDDLLLLLDCSHQYGRASSKNISMVASTHRRSTAQHPFDKFKVRAKSTLKSNIANVNNSLTKEKRLYLDDIYVRPYSFSHLKIFCNKKTYKESSTI